MKYAKEFDSFRQKIQGLELAIKAIEKIHATEKSQYRKTFHSLIRLQGFDPVFEADVELDQILTFSRASLVHICAYFIKHFLFGSSISLVMLFHRVGSLKAHIEETRHERKVTLLHSKQDPVMMASLASATPKLNRLSIRGNNKKIYRFQLEQS